MAQWPHAGDGPGDGAAGGFVTTGVLVVSAAAQEQAHEPPWLLPALDATVRWLLGSYTASTTRNAYATDLGVPRERQTWRPANSGRGRPWPGVLAQAFLRWCLTYRLDPFTDIRHDELRAWLLFARETGDSDATLRRRLAAVSAWYDAMRRRGHTATNLDDLMTSQDRRGLHLHRGQPATPTVAFTLAQVRALQVAAGLDPSDLRVRNHLIVTLLAGTGLRAAELCGLNLADVHRAGPGGVAALWVLGKGDKHRWVRLPARELALVEAYLPLRVQPQADAQLTVLGVVSHRKAAPQPLLTSASGLRLTPGGITAVLQRLARLPSPTSATARVRAAARELEPIVNTAHPHQFRHFYAQTAERNGVPVTQIRDDLGHASLTTTQAYLDGGAVLDGSAAPVVSDIVHAGL